jgi:hypothetical protein
MVKRFRFYNFHWAPEKIFKVGNEATREEARVCGANVDEKIDVAVGVGVTPGNGTEDADVMRAVLGGEAQDLVAMFAEYFLDAHGDCSLVPTSILISGSLE